MSFLRTRYHRPWHCSRLSAKPLARRDLHHTRDGLILCALILAAVRFGVRKSGFDPAVMLPMRDNLIGSISAIFALMVAFSAAEIWNDTSQANTAVQRKSNALENLLALAPSLPAGSGPTTQDRRQRLYAPSRRPGLA